MRWMDQQGWRNTIIWMLNIYNFWNGLANRVQKTFLWGTIAQNPISGWWISSGWIHWFQFLFLFPILWNKKMPTNERQWKAEKLSSIRWISAGHPPSGYRFFHSCDSMRVCMGGYKYGERSGYRDVLRPHLTHPTIKARPPNHSINLCPPQPSQGPS